MSASLSSEAELPVTRLVFAMCTVDDTLHETAAAKIPFCEEAEATRSVLSSATHEVNAAASASASAAGAAVPIASAINLSKQRINELYSITALEGLYCFASLPSAHVFRCAAFRLVASRSVSACVSYACRLLCFVFCLLMQNSSDLRSLVRLSFTTHSV